MAGDVQAELQGPKNQAWKGRRTALRRAADRREIAERYLRGQRQYIIAEQMDLTPSTVCRDIQFLCKEWIKAALVDFDEAKAQELAKINQLERTYWEGWEASKEAKVTVSRERRIDGVLVTQRQEVRSGIGDPKFLAGINACIAQRCKLLGLDAPIKSQELLYDMTSWPSWALERVASGEPAHLVKAEIEQATIEGSVKMKEIEG